MNFEVIWEVIVRTEDETWNLGLLSECIIDKSVKNLANTATIVLPEANFNQVLNLGQIIGRGDEIEIKLGYRGHQFRTEFKGYIKEIITNDGSIKIECEDSLFLFRVSVPNVQMKPASISQIANYLIQNIDSSINLVSDYTIDYEKFTIHHATAFDVLKKLQEETGADIYFENNTLHIHPAYTRKGGDVDYSPQINIENFGLEYKTAQDKRVEVVIENVALDGTITSYTAGQPGGEKITKRVGRMTTETIKIIAETEYKNRMTDGYEGSFDAWLMPYVEPSFTAGIYDSDYEYKDGRYYVDSVKTTLSEGGIVRNVQLGIKLSA